ncbi:MAG: tyrosine--tRNA ligase [Candidatus Berkelbacteria bacterium]
MADNKLKIDELLTRGVENIYPTPKALAEVLNSDKKIRIYYGIDPTGRLHLGHAVQLKKLRQFQDLGHEVIVLIGDFTARIGDPTDKSATRKALTKEDVDKHSENYKELIGKILDTGGANIRFLHNEEWTNKLKPEDLLELASYFTVSQFLERDMFQERIKAKKEIHLHEFLYPLFQAYDAVSMDVDLQIGGNDQTFNMLAGRTLMRKMKDKEKFVLTTKMLADPSGKKMGKTEGNIIPLDASANEMFGAVMSWSDELIIIGFELLTDVSMDEVRAMKREMLIGKLNPRDAKSRLAKEIVALLNSKEEAENAEKAFSDTFSKGEIPTDIEEIKLELGQSAMQLLVAKNIVTSGSEWRRLVENGAVKTEDGTKIDDINFTPTKETVLRIGKKIFVKIII